MLFGVFIDPPLYVQWGLPSPEMRGLDGRQIFSLPCKPLHGMVGNGAGCPHRLSVTFFHCYIDELIFICTNDVGSLNEWLLYLDDNRLNLKFTGTMDYKQIEFLDVVLNR